MKSKITLVTTLAVAGFCQLASSQPANNTSDIVSNWWQVEVIVFTQGNNWTTTSEIWPTDVELRYPQQYQELIPLVDPNAADANELVGNQSLDAPAASTSPGGQTIDGALNPEEIRLLPESEFQLIDVSNKINRGRRKVLFHGAWRQYMERDAPEAPIIFTAGDKYHDQYQSEGSIHIYVQRLLHFDVNLWLTEFSINAGQERQPWPDLPRRPTQRLTSTLSAQDVPDASNNQPIINNAPTDLNPGILNNNDTINTLEWLDQRGNTTFYDSRYDEILARNYVINNLATVKQDRPLRSDELNYLDHPLVGILVKIVRYNPPVPQGLGVHPSDELLRPKPN